MSIKSDDTRLKYKMGLRITENDHATLKKLAVLEELSMCQIIRNGFEKEFAKLKKKYNLV